MRSTAMGGVVALVAALGVATLPASAATAVAPEMVAAVAAAPKPAPVSSRPDLGSASVSAKAQGSRVEAESERSETSTTWANPDGTLTSDESTGPVRVRKDDGWVPLDMDLARVRGGWAPKASPSSVTFSPGGTGPAAKLEDGAKNVQMGWVDTLPAPVIKGARATYALDVNTDLVLTALPEGFEQSLVLKSAPAKAPTIHLPLDLTGLSMSDADDGQGYEFTNAAGEVVFSTPKPVMWDAQRDEAGLPSNRRTIAADMVTGGADAQLDLTPSLAWLNDPTTVYPVEIDPIITSVTRVWDTFIKDTETGVSHWHDSMVGIGLTGASKMRTIMVFANDPKYMGAHVTSAALKLWNNHAVTCTPRPVYAYPLTSPVPSGLSWANQPTINTTSTYSASKSFSHGLDGQCANAFDSLDVTKMTAGWASGALTNYGIELRASESDATQRKYFCAMSLDTTNTTSCTTSARKPTLSVTYNTVPKTAGTPTHTPGTSSNTATPGWTSTTTPTLKATVSDPDGGTVQGLFSVYLNGTGTPVVNKAPGSSVASGGTSTYVVPAGKLVNGSMYVVRAYGYDGSLTSAAWSTGYDRFIVDTTVPNPPTVSSTTWTDGSWTPATSGTISWSDTSPDVTSYSWKLDAGSWSAFTSATSQALSGLARDQEHTVSVRGKETSGQISATTDFTFGVGVQCSTSGSRAASQPLTHQLNDSTAMSLNPTNGNLNLSGSLLRLRGVGQDLNIGWRHNGLNDNRPTLNTGLAETALQPWTDGSFSYVAPDGGCYTFAKTGSTWSIPAGINATLTSPVAGTMTLRFNPSGIVNTYVLTGGVYQLTQSSDKNTANPNLIRYTYTAGKLTSILDTQDRVVTFAYTDVNNPAQPSTITDTSLSRTINLAYGGPGGALSQVTDATGAVSDFDYDATGLISLTNNGNQTSFGYDPSSRLTSWTYGAGSPDAGDWTASYDSTIKTTITDGNSNAATYTIDGSRTTKITDPLGHGATSKWDLHDNLENRTDAMGNLTVNDYNPNNLLEKITSPAGTLGGAGASQSLTFPTAPTGGLGDYQPTGTADAQGNTAAIGYDTNTRQANSITRRSQAGVAIGGTKTATIQGDGAGTNCGAKTGEVCTTSNGNNNITAYGYDGAGNPTSITPPAPLGARAFTYDAAGRVLSGTDGRGNTSFYTYDANGRTTAVSQAATGCPAATCVAYTYDDAGNLTSRTSPTGVTSIDYDALNRPTTKTQAGVLASTATYDPASNLTSYTDTSGTTGYGYDTANRLVSLAEPGGSCPDYPAIAATPNATACTVFSYDNANRRTRTSYPTGQVSMKAYDGAGRMLAVLASNAAGTTLAWRMYTYQAATPSGADQSLRATMTDQSGTTTYRYDGLNRLNKATEDTTTISNWEYDNDGNRTSAAKTGTPTVYSAFNEADQLCWSSTTSGSDCASAPAGATTYAYDASGNQTSDQLADGPTLANTFNVFNQLTDTLVGGGATLTSTYADTSNTERLSAGATSFINGTLGLTGQTTSGDSISFIRDPYGNLVAMRTADQSYYYTSDAQGSVIALTDSTQGLVAAYTYDPWGNTTSSTGSLATTNPWTYATGYTDPTTGYLKLGARYYNPTTGRFTQPDPAGQEPNTYNYASCNPTNNTDPTGLDALGCVGAVTGFLGAGISFTVAGFSLLSTAVDGPVGPLAAWGFVGVGLGAVSAGIAGVQSCTS